MNYCPHCGTQLDPNATFCQNCGRSTATGQQQYQDAARAPVSDDGSFGWAVLGFFIPLAGLILYLVWRHEKPLSARRAGKGALVGVIVEFLFGFLLGFITACLGA